MATLKIKKCVFGRILPKNELPQFIFMIDIARSKITFLGEGDSLPGYTDANHLHLGEVILVLSSLFIKINVCKLILGKILLKTHLFIFRVAILK